MRLIKLLLRKRVVTWMGLFLSSQLVFANQKSLSFFEEAAQGAHKYRASDWVEYSGNAHRTFEVAMRESQTLDFIASLVEYLGGNASTNVAIVFAEPHAFVAHRFSHPYSTIDISSLSEKKQEIVRDQAKRENAVCKEIVARCIREPTFLKNYSVLCYWLGYLGGHNKSSAIENMYSRAKYVYNGFPGHDKDGYYWFSREALVLIQLSGKTEILDANKDNNVQAIFAQWFNEWTQQAQSFGESPSRDKRIEMLLDVTTIDETIEASGYRKLWQGIPKLLLELL